MVHTKSLNFLLCSNIEYNDGNFQFSNGLKLSCEAHVIMNVTVVGDYRRVDTTAAYQLWSWRHGTPNYLVALLLLRSSPILTFDPAWRLHLMCEGNTLNKRCMIHKPKVVANFFLNRRKEKEKVTNAIDDVYELHDIIYQLHRRQYGIW